MELSFAGLLLGFTMKLNAIMLILASLCSAQGGVDVVNSVIQPVTNISAETRLNHSEFENESKIIQKAADQCRSQNLLEQITGFSAALMTCYEDPESFYDFLKYVQEESGEEPVELITSTNERHRTILKLFLTKLDKFEYKSSKREHNAQLIADLKLLRSVAFEAETVMNELDMLVTQFTMVDVPMGNDFLSDIEIADLSVNSEKVLSSLQA